MSTRVMFQLPEGVDHGTPEGFAAGCRKEKHCPALYEHGMACLYAHLRAANDIRYYKAKARDPRPAAIARALGMSPDRSVADVAEHEANQARIDQHHAARSAAQRARHASPANETPSTPDTPKEPTMTLTDTIEPQADNDVAAAAPATPHAPKKPRKPPTPAPGSGRTKAEFALIRAWARDNGHQVATAGRLPTKLIELYDAREDTTDERAKTIATNQAAVDDIEKANAEHRATIAEAEAAAAAVDQEQDFTPISGLLDETRDRIDLPRPEWAAVTVPEDITQLTDERDRARALAARLEQELARAEDERDTALRSLELTLRKWDDAKEQLAAAAVHHLDHLVGEGLDRLTISELRVQNATLKSELGAARILAAMYRDALDVLVETPSEQPTDTPAPAERSPWWKRGA